MKVKFLYELTGNLGETLFDSLKDAHFDELVRGQSEAYLKDAVPGGDFRDRFVEECLWRELTGSDLDVIVKANPGIKFSTNENIKEWLLNHKCPAVIADEEMLINEWASERAQSDAEDGFLWDIDKSDDVEVSLHFGLVKYPPTDKNGRYVDDDAESRAPADIANKIKEYTDKANSEADEKKAKALREIADDLERKTVECLIKVKGFYCDIHGGKVLYKESIPKSEVITCPSCGHPICPVCANAYSDDPKTIEDARKYIASCDDNSGMAWCGQCGDWGEGFMLGFLRLVECPVPSEYESPSMKMKARATQFYTTARVAALADAGSIVAQVKRKFNKGVSGIIKIPHSSGEIWGYPERYPEGWVVAILYPEER